MEGGELPLPSDAKIEIPPAVTGYARRVTGFNLWLVYRLGETGVLFVVLLTPPPIPVEG